VSGVNIVPSEIVHGWWFGGSDEPLNPRKKNRRRAERRAIRRAKSEAALRERNKRILALFQSGLTRKAVAAEVGVTYNVAVRVIRLANANGETAQAERHTVSRAKRARRNKAIVRRRLEDGWSTRRVARHFHLSIDTIQKIVQKHNRSQAAGS